MIVSFYLSFKNDSIFTFGSSNDAMVKQGPAEDGYGVHWLSLTGTNWW